MSESYRKIKKKKKKKMHKKNKIYLFNLKFKKK